VLADSLSLQLALMVIEAAEDDLFFEELATVSDIPSG
jgi:hypothetical protein